MPLRHLVDFNGLTIPEWNEIYTLAAEIQNEPKQFSDACKGSLLATLFYEPSTRTMLSFQTAMLRLGGEVIGFDNPGTSSVAKGESLKDTVTMVAGYADIIAIRHPCEGAALAASLFSPKPIINAGDGGHFHPTQTLTDLYTITKEKGQLNGQTIGICGDLAHGRTVHSLLRALNMFGKNTYYLISTLPLKLPQYIIDILKANGSEIIEITDLDECMDKLDILYMTRIQKERFASEEQYKRQSGKYILNNEKMKFAKSDMIIMHPLPRVDEIAEEIDYDSRAFYFKQAANGVFVRMALILKMLETRKNSDNYIDIQNISAERIQKCPNPACITKTEKYLPLLTKDLPAPRGGTACEYCDYRII